VLSNFSQTDMWLPSALPLLVVWRCGWLRPGKDVHGARYRQFGASRNCCRGPRLAGNAWASLGRCHFPDSDFRECAYRAPPQGMVVVAVAPAIMGIEIILILAASLALASGVAPRS